MALFIDVQSEPPVVTTVRMEKTAVVKVVYLTVLQ
jgi:hypothetical protein